MAKNITKSSISLINYVIKKKRIKRNTKCKKKIYLKSKKNRATVIETGNKYVNLQRSEHLVTIILWLAIFTATLLRPISQNQIDWEWVITTCKITFPFFVLYTINHYIIIPRFLFRQRSTKLFLLINTISLTVLMAYRIIIMPMPSPPPPPDKFGQEQEKNRTHKPPVMPIVMFGVTGVLIVGFDTGLRLLVRINKIEKDKAIAERKYTESKLIFLKRQASPHFLMNTLNNIHALIDIDTEMAKEATIKLSHLMRYLLYESSLGNFVSIKSESDFISSYIELMKIRFTEKVRITYKRPEVFPQKNIPPLLFISLIENAFKHGVSYREESYVDVALEIRNNERELRFMCSNSKIAAKPKENEKGGLGLSNTREQLELIYGDMYKMEINETDNNYTIKLTVPL